MNQEQTIQDRSRANTNEDDFASALELLKAMIKMNETIMEVYITLQQINNKLKQEERSIS